MTTTSIRLCWTRTSLSTRCFRQCRNIPTLEPLTGLRPERASMAEALTTATKLLVVREIQEDEAGATLCFQQGAHGRLAVGDPNYGSHLQLARRSQERRHPVGVGFGEAHAVTDLIRADNDVPKELWDEDADRALVLFEGHDGVFRVKTEH